MRSTSVHSQLRAIADQIWSSVDAPSGAILQLLDDGGCFGFVGAWGPGSAQLLEPNLTIPRSSIAGRCVDTRRPVSVADAQQSHRHFRIVDRLTGETTHRVLALPFVRDVDGISRWFVLELLGADPNLDLSSVAAIVRQSGAHPVGWPQ